MPVTFYTWIPSTPIYQVLWIREEALAAQQAYANGEKLKTGKKLYSFGLKCADKVGKLYGTVTAVASDPVGTIKSKV